MITLGVNDFVKRQTEDSSYTHFNGSWDEIIRLAHLAWDSRQPGYRDGVVLVRIQGDFFHPIVNLEPDQVFLAVYKPRVQGETPRISFRARGRKTPTSQADLVFYRHDVLDGNATTDAEWELVSVNGLLEDGTAAPMDFITLMENHFGGDGGTATNMSPAEFEAALRKSYAFWRNRAHVQGA